MARGVKNEFWSCRQTFNFAHRHFKRCRDIRIRGLVESHVAVADLDEAQLSHGVLRICFRHSAQGVGLQHSTLNYAEGARTRPGHALQEPSAVNSIVVMRSEEHTS